MAGAGIHPYHQQWAAAQQQQQQPPPATVPPPPMSMPMPPMPMANPIRPLTEEVRTIFISGLPEDVKDRELQNLMRWLPGFEASQLNFKGEQPMGFALFSSAQFAIAAKDALQDMVFDPEAKSVLHTEMAKKNLFVKRGVIPEPNTFDQSKRMRTGGDYTQTGYQNTQTGYQNAQTGYQNTQTGYQNAQTGYQSPSPFQPPPAPVWGPPQGYMAPPMPPPMAPAPPPYDPYAGYAMAPVPMPTPAPVPAPSGYAPVQNAKDNPPCNTLFIGNLGENTIEEELRGLFSVQPGFKQMKVLRQERNTVCFIEFDDVNNATNVHTNLQGAVIPSSGRGGMRIQYSKNPFGRRKDGFPGVMQMPPEANGAPQMPLPIPMPTYQ